MSISGELEMNIFQTAKLLLKKIFNMNKAHYGLSRSGIYYLKNTASLKGH